MTAPAISVVIPTRDGAATLPALLDALWRQRTLHPVEIVVVDSGSTNGTLDLARPHVARLLPIRPADFDHGLARNVGIENATGEFVVLLVQDALPVGDDWLDTLVAPLIDDASVAGAFARQAPRPEASALTRAMLARWVASGTEPWVTGPMAAAEFDALAPAERLRRCAFDNVASVVRRAVWVRHPFRATPIAEDLEWARDVLLAGHRIAFVPDAVVVHSHDRPARQEYRRTRALHARLAALFELRTIPTRAALARAVASSLVEHLWCERHTSARWPRSAALAIAWPLGQYLGGRDAEPGQSILTGRGRI